jgi:hypothetical protein
LVLRVIDEVWLTIELTTSDSDGTAGPEETPVTKAVPPRNLQVRDLDQLLDEYRQR